MNHFTPARYFPENLEEYAPWVAKHGLVAPYGKCQCGCDLDTLLAPKTNTKYGRRKNAPLRYINGHNGIENANDLAGQVFGRLTAIEPVSSAYGKGVTWLCRCACGNTLNVLASGLRSGNSRSCGCFQRDRASQTKTEHGLSNHPLYRLRGDIIKRCTNPKANNFKNYGGRGIKLYDEWRHNFQAFFDYVSKLEHYGEKGYTFDRINNDGNYEPGNVRWATRIQQSHNSRKVKMITYNGETKPIAEWARIVGINRLLLGARLKANWTIECALFSPVGTFNPERNK